jgi:hypothetical protein
MLRQGAAPIHYDPPLEACFMSKTSLKNVQKQKKKAKRAIPRAPQTRIQGNTTGVRTRLKKLAGQARAKKAASA